MPRDWLERALQWLKRIVTQPAKELNRWQRTVRFAYDVGRFGARQLQHDRAPEMAAALAFRTLFGLLPVMVMATVLVRAMGFQEHFLEPLGRLFEFWGLDDIQVLLPIEDDQPVRTLATWLDDRVRETEDINWAAIGWVGLAVTAYAAISLMVTIENSFNIIFRAPQGRSWTFRVPLYWFALTISPVAIVLSAYVSGYFERLVGSLQGRTWLATSIDVAWSLLSIWAVIVFVYLLLPNVRVRLRAALAGGLVAAVLLEIGKRTMGAYLSRAVSFSQLYGSLGLVPLFMFWVHLMWMAVLFGLQVSSIMQHLRGRRLAELEEQQEKSAFVDASVVLIIMQQIAERFQAGQSTGIDHLMQTTEIPGTVLEKIVQRLVEEGLLHRMAEDENQLSLSRPAETVAVERLMEIGLELAEPAVPGDGRLTGLLEQLRTAQLRAVGRQQLAELLPHPAARAAANLEF